MGDASTRRPSPEAFCRIPNDDLAKGQPAFGKVDWWFGIRSWGSDIHLGLGRDLLSVQPRGLHNGIAVATAQNIQRRLTREPAVRGEHERRLRPGIEIAQFGKNPLEAVESNLPYRVGVAAPAKAESNERSSLAPLVDRLASDSEGICQCLRRRRATFRGEKLLLQPQAAQSCWREGIARLEPCQKLRLVEGAQKRTKVRVHIGQRPCVTDVGDLHQCVQRMREKVVELVPLSRRPKQARRRGDRAWRSVFRGIIETLGE